MMQSLQCLNSSRRSGSMPRMSAITSIGTGIARSWTTSKAAPLWSFFMQPSTIAAMRGCQSAMRRGVKPRLTMPRNTSWRGGSRVMIDSVGPCVSIDRLTREVSRNRASSNTSRQPGFAVICLNSTSNAAADENSSG